ncbi:MAG: hypothetical protein RJA57_1247 [Bacteroidota bacterium]
MKMDRWLYLRALSVLLALIPVSGWTQLCTNLGQTPSTAFPVCATTTFRQSTVPLCSTNDIYVPGCTGTGANYQNKNPYFYKFTCYVAGTLAFVITPLQPNEDYDWQLWDITGRDPNEIFTVPSLVVTGNWSGTYGPTGASASGVNRIQCASDPAANEPAFAAMPTLVAGHVYLLMVSHFTDGQGGYDLSFAGGTAVIADPTLPKTSAVSTSCDGTKVTLKLNKKVRCNTASASGSEFSIDPAVATITASATDSCGFGFDFDEITLTLSTPLPNGTYDLVIGNGTDGNTLRDNCDNAIPVGERIAFTYAAPVPIRADSIGRVPCAPDSIRVYYPKKIRCSTISANGSDFTLNGPTPVTVSGAAGSCTNDESDFIVVRFSAPIQTKGTYTLTIQPGIDGSPIFDACGQPIQPQTLRFNTVDTVHAGFQYRLLNGCIRDTLLFSHDGANDVNSWTWNFNNLPPVTTQNHQIVFPSSSTNTVQLIVSNGTCTDTAVQTITLNNEVRAVFEAEKVLCPEDPLRVTNRSVGAIDTYRWSYDVVGSSTLKDPPPFRFPILNREAFYTVRLVVTNQTLGCSDSARLTLTVLDHCRIDVPTAFTPNNDGRNDLFRPHNALKAVNYDFRIFNRWGQPVFLSSDWTQGWDGRLNGILQSTGVYVWMLRYTDRDSGEKVFRKGTVTLIR